MCEPWDCKFFFHVFHWADMVRHFISWSQQNSPVVSEGKNHHIPYFRDKSTKTVLELTKEVSTRIPPLSTTVIRKSVPHVHLSPINITRGDWCCSYMPAFPDSTKSTDERAVWKRTAILCSQDECRCKSEEICPDLQLSVCSYKLLENRESTFQKINSYCKCSKSWAYINKKSNMFDWKTITKTIFCLRNISLLVH